MLKAILFDMDGVIVDTEPLHSKAYHMMFDAVNIVVTDELYESFTGQSTISICRTLVSHFQLSGQPETLVALKRKFFKQIFETDENLHLIDGVLDLIKDYHSNGLTLVLASSASMTTINNVFTRFNLDRYFVAKLSGADLKASKPHPEIFIKAAESSGYKKSECLVIEDSTNGINAAKTAGIYCVGFKSPHSKNQDYSNANIVINNFNEVDFSAASQLLN